MSAEIVEIDGVRHSATKGFFEGTQRTQPPEATLEAILRAAPTVGLTRLADITGLDRIGVPTYAGYRPNAPTLAASAGKGATPVAAQVSAGMEAVEIWHAENVALELVVASHRELAAEGLTMPRAHLPLTKNSLFDDTRPEAWLWGWDLLARKRVAVPYASVSMGNNDHRVTERWMPFAAGSNGLAGGNHILESVAAALYEVVERDAIACQRVAGTAMRDRVDHRSIADPVVLSLIDQYEAAGVTPYLFDCTVDTRVPTYMAVVADRLDPTMGLYRGYGAHLDPGIAMIRALTEAAQARLVLLAGSRDDYFGRDQRVNRFAADGRIESLDQIPVNADATRHEAAANDSFGADIHAVLDRLVAVGLRSAVVVDLTREELGIPVARMVVPELEGYVFDHYTPGRRALAHLHATATPA
jgi:ribosomal protein S12 methylthiotransferase accessory factor